jgi:hypothetical protein
MGAVASVACYSLTCVELRIQSLCGSTTLIEFASYELCDCQCVRSITAGDEGPMSESRGYIILPVLSPFRSS